MAKKTYINLARESFVAELSDSPVYSKNGLHQGYLFRINDKKGEIVGCLSAFISRTTKAMWDNPEKLTPETIEDLFLRILPHIPFTATISELSDIYPDCIQLFIDPSDTKYDKENKIQFIKSRENPYNQVKDLVFDGELDDDKVQKDILTYLYEIHIENHMAFTHTVEMAKKLFLDENTVFRCLNYLKDENFVEGITALGSPGLTVSKITTAGVRYMKNNFQQINLGTGVIIMGDFVGKDKISTTITGNDNQTNIKSTISDSFNMTVVNQKADELKEAIKNEYTGEDKQVLLDQVEEIKTLAPEKKNWSRIRGIIGGIISKTAKIVKIGVFAIELLKVFAIVH